jgi:hypothetical protein
MTVYIHKTDSPEQIDKKIARIMRTKGKSNKKAFDPYEFLGKGIFKGVDGLKYQKKVRNEWE